MSDSRLKIKIGESELEVQGETEFVQRQFDEFKRLLAIGHQAELPAEDNGHPPISWEKIIRRRGRILSLSAPATVEEAVLVLLLSHHHFRKEEDVTGSEIMNGLRDSGIEVPRADTALLKHAKAGSVIVNGRRRSRRYRLSAAGAELAAQFARSLTAQAL